MKSPIFDSSCLLVSVVIPFKNNVFSCNVQVQISFMSVDNNDFDIVDYEDFTSFMTGSGVPVSVANARVSFSALGLEIDDVIGDYVAAILTKPVILEYVKKGISSFKF